MTLAVMQREMWDEIFNEKNNNFFLIFEFARLVFETAIEISGLTAGLTTGCIV